MEKQIAITVESKIYNKDTSILSEYGKIQQHISRTLFNELINGDEVVFKEFQKKYIKKYNIHARLFKTIWKDVNGQINSIKSNNENRIQYLEKKLKNEENKVKKNKLKQRLENAKKGVTSRVWGGKFFYNKQWNAKDKESWLKSWRRKRDHQIYVIGSKDESFGNSLCQLSTLKTLRLTLPKKFENKHLILNVNFDREKNNYKLLKQAINNNQALTYRIFERENGHWYIQISFMLTNECKEQNNNLGIDINYNLICTCIENNGNPIKFNNYKYDLEETTKNQNKEILIRLARNIIQHAKESKTNIIIENINLKNKEKNRKISLVVYSKFIGFLKSCAVKNGVLVKEINPAFTSIIAKHKYSKQLGRTIHSCASLVIARRGKRYKDKVPSHLVYLLQSGERNKNLWKQWSFVNKRLKLVPLESNEFLENLLDHT